MIVVRDEGVSRAPHYRERQEPRSGSNVSASGRPRKPATWSSRIGDRLSTAKTRDEGVRLLGSPAVTIRCSVRLTFTGSFGNEIGRSASHREGHGHGREFTVQVVRQLNRRP